MMTVLVIVIISAIETDIVIFTLDAEMKDETEEPVDLIPTLIPLPPDEVYMFILFFSQYIPHLIALITFCSAAFCKAFVSDLLSVCCIALQVPSHSAVFINEPRLSEFKQIVVSKGIQAEMSGGVLICNNVVAVRRVSCNAMYSFFFHFMSVLCLTLMCTISVFVIAVCQY